MQTFDFVNRANADYIEQLFQQYRKDPTAVAENWRAYFSGFEMGAGRTDLDHVSPSADRAPGDAATGEPTRGDPATGSPATGDFALGRLSDEVPIYIGVFDLVHSYRELGHCSACLDPLGAPRPPHPLLDLSNFDMTNADLDRSVGKGGFGGQTDGTLRDLIGKLRETYCDCIGVEFTGITDKEQREWLQTRIEANLNHAVLSEADKKQLLFELIACEELEHYLGRQFIGAKRFSIEGAESLVPLLNGIIENGAGLGAEAVVMAMAHRGRLNVLAHVLNKPYENILSEFAGTVSRPAGVQGDGDVKYHLGYSNKRNMPKGKVKVSLLPNPSHLELVNPIQQGIVRCKQEWGNDPTRTKIVPVCIHGDAAFCGQGIVPETLSLSELPGYETGGTIHIIVNNQIGFTTSPKQGRFTPYPTDMAKGINAPIFHVNGDDPEAVAHVARLAIGFREQFKCDVIIDMWCYRRHGHNEQDEPSFTQPVMYRKIASHPSVRTLYAQKLLEAGVVTQDGLDKMKQDVVERLGTARESAKEVRPRLKVPKFSGVWTGFGPAGDDWSAQTAVKKSVLETVVAAYDNLPDGFTPHPKLKNLVINGRREMIKAGEGIDYGCGEMLALGSLLLEGTSVRFTGQDVERGTFSHRHAVLHDYETGDCYTPLNHVGKGQGKFFINNTMLSEEAVLAYEWGYSSADPRTLVLWEAQFGDFVNGAQAIIDQIIAAAESKWHYMNGLVLLLPHGYEGAGPEHSNAYLERFLSLSAEGNMQVAVPSTPASYFHLLRRQMHRKFRKPLILMMPKSLLRKKEASSSIDDFTQHDFRPVLDDPRFAVATPPAGASSGAAAGSGAAGNGAAGNGGVGNGAAGNGSINNGVISINNGVIGGGVGNNGAAGKSASLNGTGGSNNGSGTGGTGTGGSNTGGSSNNGSNTIASSIAGGSGSANNAGTPRASATDPQAGPARDKVTRLLLCCGKVFYALDAARHKNAVTDTAIVRLEQLYPLPEPELSQTLNKYPRVTEVCWVQEEPQNRGAWGYMQPILRQMLPDTLVSYHGRDAAASPATGSMAMHEAEERELIASALDLSKREVPEAALELVDKTPATAAQS